ncbi:MAG: hypothetical protein ACYDH4_10925 [Candidatus Cryosericum sp.]
MKTETFTIKFYYLWAGSNDVHERVFSADITADKGTRTVFYQNFLEEEAFRKKTAHLLNSPPSSESDAEFARLEAEWLATCPEWMQVIWFGIPDDLAKHYVIEDIRVGKNSQWLKEVPPAGVNLDWYFRDSERVKKCYGEVPAKNFADSAPRRDMRWDKLNRQQLFTVKVRRT